MKPMPKRQKQVLMDVAEALSNKEIASHLGIAMRTVKLHLRGLFSRFRITGRYYKRVRLLYRTRRLRGMTFLLLAGTALASDTESVTLKWQPGGKYPSTVEYLVYKQPARGLESLVATLPQSTTNWVDYSVSEGKTYYYSVAAFDTATGVEAVTLMITVVVP